jgi:serine/threonine-protein kinase
MENLLAIRYRLIKPLGQGGFGATYLAEDDQMPSNRLCVVKQLCPQANDPLYLPLIQDRFRREATILEDVGKGHSQIPDLYAYFNEDGQFYLVQEWIEGVTLGESVAQQGCWSEIAVQNFLIKILPTLIYIHGKGVIHRDIKPDNIILRSSDQYPVLIDFGAVRETMGTALNQGNSTNTIIIGTPGYMPQEQGVGRPVFSSDLYSLGLTAIFLLTGKHPIQLSHDPSTGEVIWRNHVPKVGESLSSILDQSICSHASGRFATAQAMLEALQQDSAHAQTLINAPANFAPRPTNKSSTLVAAPGPVAATDLSAITTLKGISDWQKMMLTGIMVGAFALAAIVLMRPPSQEAEPSGLSPVRAEVDQIDPINVPLAETPITEDNEAGISKATSGSSGTPAIELSDAAISDVASAPMEPSASADPPDTFPETSHAPNLDEYSWLSQRYVVESELRGKTAWQLDVMRNSIFARHGRLFKDRQLQTYFNQQPWYQPIYMPDEFPSSLVSPIEDKNAAFILEYQNRNSLRHVP